MKIGVDESIAEEFGPSDSASSPMTPAESPPSIAVDDWAIEKAATPSSPMAAPEESAGVQPPAPVTQQPTRTPTPPVAEARPIPPAPEIPSSPPPARPASVTPPPVVSRTPPVSSTPARPTPAVSRQGPPPRPGSPAFSSPGVRAPRLTPPATSSSASPRPTAPTRPTPVRAPINPFLANDPNAKARRLARALISDLVTYFPDRRDEGLREGTLKQLFREEIRKSYDEYVLQVGEEFAEATTHFKDALNDILAGGQKAF
jgi:hypothetical protein